MQHEITTPGKLLDSLGRLSQPGWAKDLMLQYKKADIKAGKLRIKEWDYYAVLSDSFGIAFTISDNGYLGLTSVTFFDFVQKTEHTETILTLLPMGKYNMPETSHIGNVSFNNKKLKLDFIKTPEARVIKCHFKGFQDGKDLHADIMLMQPSMDTMVIATPWAEDPLAFYYNQKINCLRASGSVTLSGKEYSFAPDKDMATLDWGRGVWTYRNTWYWGSGNGLVNGKPFGFNIGYGFGDSSAATENILQYDGKAHKLDQVTFHIPQDSYMKPWRFSSNDGRFEMDFQPILDRAANINAIFVSSDQHQVFGKMSGQAVLDNGDILQISNLLCFAEKVSNRF
jgi:hypothetical protein